MAGKLFAGKTRMRAFRVHPSRMRAFRVCASRAWAFLVFLWIGIGVMCVGMVSPVYAASEVLLAGSSGTCMWTYTQIGDDIVLTITPINGEKGTLGSYTWHLSKYKETTKRVVVKGTVKGRADAESMFDGFKQAHSFDLQGLDVSNVTSMERMFYGCFALTSLDVSGWDVSNVENMHAMFLDCSALTSLDVSSWNVSKVRSMQSMFSGCEALALLDVSAWDVSNVRELSWMFFKCKTLVSLDVSSWNVSNVAGMESVFFGCSALTVLDVSRWDVSQVTGMESMFSGCSALTSLDLSRWQASDENIMRNMFANTHSLGRITLGSNFLIEDVAAFDSAGSRVGAKWMQVNLGKGGTYKNPKGKTFESSYDLLAFHRDRTLRDTDVEAYVRVAPAELTASFDKGSSDATGEMPPKVYDHGAVEESTRGRA